MNPIIEISGIRTLRNNQLTSPLSLALRAGEGVGIFGPNGSGKSTFLDIVAGILPSKEARIQTATQIGYAMQKDGFHENLSCKDNLLLEANYAGVPKAKIKDTVEECASVCGAEHYLNKKVARLSAGMRARLAIAASLVCQPKILLMDESFNALDVASAKEIKGMLMQKKEEGLAFIFVSHDREEFTGLCEKVLYFPTLEVHSL